MHYIVQLTTIYAVTIYIYDAVEQMEAIASPCSYNCCNALVVT